jgi:dTDP-4-amino-4,6-dideoxygalactose transaminase
LPISNFIKGATVLAVTRLRPGKIQTSCPGIPEDILELKDDLIEILNSKRLSNFSKYTAQLEEHIRNLIGVEYVLTVPNASTGLHMVLSCLPRDTEVLVPSFTFPSTVHAIVHAHLLPTFVDIERNTYNICPKDLEKKITEKTSAILAVNAFGNPCKIDWLQNLAQQYNLKLFFDSAAAFGSIYDGHLLGAFGHAEVFSMSGTKVETAGEGGFITTNDDQLAIELTHKSNYGYSRIENDCLYIGFNGKLSEFNAILALSSLARMKRNIAKRCEIADIYYSSLQYLPGIRFQEILDDAEPNYCSFAIEIDPIEFGLDASTLRDRLKEENIEAIRYFSPPMHKTRAYKEFNQIRLEHTESLSACILCLPMHPALTTEQAHRVCSAVSKIHAKAKSASVRLGVHRRKQLHPSKSGSTLRMNPLPS